jgi:alkylation response protein AidB-like acyl-CoA dehydrogenase
LVSAVVSQPMDSELRYHPSVEQLELAGTFNESLEALLPLARLHLSQQESEQTWSSLESLGLFGVGVSEENGGSGLGAAEEALIVMQLGRCLAAPSVLATVGASHASTRAGMGAANGLGRTAAAYLRGDRIVMVEDNRAALVLVRAGADTALYDNALVCRPIDNHLWLSPLQECTSGPEPLARFDGSGLLLLRLIDAAALCGIAEAALSMSVAYAGLRKQFGRPIGSFQAIKHHCANMAIAARCARDQATFAAVAVDDRRDDAALQVDCALLVAGRAALGNAGTNIQVHGGIGFSDEADPHLLVKRAQLLIMLAGGLEAANSRVAEARRHA